MIPAAGEMIIYLKYMEFSDSSRNHFIDIAMISENVLATRSLRGGAAAVAISHSSNNTAATFLYCPSNAYKLASNDANSYATGQPPMRTTLNLDDELLMEAQRISGVSGRTALVTEGLRALIERESARRLARLGGSEPQLQPVPRRQSDPA